MNRYIFPVIIVAVLVFGLISLNSGMSKNAQPEHDDDDQQQSQTDTTKKTPPPPAAHTAPTSAPGSTVVAPNEVVLGDPSKAKYKITAGWSYDSSNQADSSKLTSTIAALQNVAKSSNGQVSVQIVDVDLPPDQRSTATKSIQDVGISVNGKPVSGDNLGEGGSAPEAVSSGIGTMVKH